MREPLARPSKDARERILDTAYELFSRNGIRAVGVDRVIAESGVAKMTLYRHFASKDELVLEFMRRREERWTKEWLQAEVEQLADDPGERLLAIFDVFDAWFRQADFEGCTFINVLLEITDPESPLRQASVVHLANIRVFLEGLGTEAGVADPEDFARRWHILMWDRSSPPAKATARPRAGRRRSGGSSSRTSENSRWRKESPRDGW